MSDPDLARVSQKASAAGDRVTQFGWGILGLLFFATTVNYLDRMGDGQSRARFVPNGSRAKGFWRDESVLLVLNFFVPPFHLFLSFPE